MKPKTTERKTAPIHRWEPQESGGQGQNRTADTRIFSPLLYQLSYLAGKAANYRRSMLPRQGPLISVRLCSSFFDPALFFRQHGAVSIVDRERQLGPRSIRRKSLQGHLAALRFPAKGRTAASSGTGDLACFAADGVAPWRHTQQGPPRRRRSLQLAP